MNLTKLKFNGIKGGTVYFNNALWRKTGAFDREWLMAVIAGCDPYPDEIKGKS